MIPELISTNEDLTRLWMEGHVMEIVEGTHLLVHRVPYVNSQKEVKRGALLTTLNLSGKRVLQPETHVIYFIGEYPCHQNGTPIKQLFHDSTDRVIVKNITINHSFSNKPLSGSFGNYYDKITSYIRVISHPAKSIDSSLTERTFEVLESAAVDSVFHYIDTNSSRAEINVISDKLKQEKIAIVGLGGTGSYVLDFLAKTPVLEIHLFDGDEFLQHNAFRAPGATPKERFYEHLKKTDYLQSIYSNMHRYVFSHPENLSSVNISLLAGLTFVFICMDGCPEKEDIIRFLEENKVPFIDVGLGIEEDNGSLYGNLRTTTSLDGNREHTKTIISFAKAGEALYDQNIQIAELNSLNASMAVIKWKKLLGFYKDHEKELNSIYTIHLNEIINDKIPT